MTEPVFDVIRRGPALINPATNLWLTPREVTGKVLVFIHGFTSHGQYMQELAAYAQGHGFVTALFNYDSYSGIDSAAVSLRDLLRLMSSELIAHRYALIGHSMGGLVALQFASGPTEPLRSALAGIVLLGVPMRGALANKKMLRYMLDWSEWLTGPNPYARNAACRSARQLTGNDSDRLLVDLASRTATLRPPVLSISGGRNYLEFGQGSLSGLLRNRALQRLIGSVPNDGLVAETSADITRGGSAPSMRHERNYPGYTGINHTFLTRNQQIANIAVSWLQSTAFST